MYTVLQPCMQSKLYCVSTLSIFIICIFKECTIHRSLIRITFCLCFSFIAHILLLLYKKFAQTFIFLFFYLSSDGCKSNDRKEEEKVKHVFIRHTTILLIGNVVSVICCAYTLLLLLHFFTVEQ